MCSADELVSMRRVSLLLLIVALAGCGAADRAPLAPIAGESALSAGFLAVDGVYNSELMAPYDILHHSVFRDSLSHIVPFVVSPDGKPVTTFEGLEIGAHYSFADAPAIDILVIPSAEGSMSADLENEKLISWIRETALDAKYVITLCDGSFPLAATGLLDGLNVTTFPADRDALRDMFPTLTVHYDANFVVHGKYITSVGGALSYEPALYLLESEYSVENAVETANGLVLNWDLASIAHYIAAE
jgi:transcriptional regulator GlxA family with amidase domain